MHRHGILVCAGAALLAAGCALQPYSYGTGRSELDAPLSPQMQEQFLFGEPHALLDASDWIWPGSLLGKLLLWDKDVDSHEISAQTVASVRQYVEENDLRNVQVLVNGYYPVNQWERLLRNRTVSPWWRYTLGLLSVIGYTLLPGRIVGGDAYNPYTNTIYLYSNDISIALHEAGHAKDFGARELKGTNAAAYAVPFAALYYEANATSDALGYLDDKQCSEAQKDAYHLLYPAYATYVGGNLSLFAPDVVFEVIGLGVLAGHVVGRIAGSRVAEQPGPCAISYEVVDEVDAPAPQEDPTPDTGRR